MDSKWGGVIVAALAGLGFVCLINREPRKKVMEAEIIEPQMDEVLKPDEESLDKRPQLDDFVEMNVAKMVEHLKWLQRHPQFNTRNMRVDKLLNDPKHGLQSVLDSYNEKRKKDGKRDYPPLKFNDYTVYADKYGKCPEGYTPTKHGWITGECFKTLEDGTIFTWKGEKDIGSKGPLNTFFQKSGYLKHDTPMAMHLARETLHETGKYYTKDADPDWKDKDPVEKLRAQYHDPKIQAELMDNQTMDEYAHWLWLEQFTKNNRKVLRGQHFPMPFNIDTCRKFIEYLYVEATYQGYMIEEKAIDDLTDSYANPHGGHPSPVYRLRKEVGGHPTLPIHLYSDIAVTFTGKTMDLTHKVDLLVRPNGEDDIVLAGVQVKPLSFFTQTTTLETMLKKHRILGGDIESLTTSKKEKKALGKNIMPKIESFPDNEGNKRSNKPKSNFNVQTLVYDGYTKEFLNYEAVLLRIQANIPDPILTNLPEWKDKNDTEARTLVKNFFINQRANEKQAVSDKIGIYLNVAFHVQSKQQQEAKHRRDEQRRQEGVQARIEAQDKLQQEKAKAKKDKIFRERKEKREREAKKQRKRKQPPFNPFKEQPSKKKKGRRR